MGKHKKYKGSSHLPTQWSGESSVTTVSNQKIEPQSELPDENKKPSHLSLRTIARCVDAKERVFPSMDNNFYKGLAKPEQLSADQRLAQRLVSLKEINLTKLQKLIGWNLNEKEKFGRLFDLHQRAMEEEMEGNWERADFFWEEVYGALSKLYKQTDIWDFLIKTFGDNEVYRILTDGLILQTRIINEVFVDCHCGFYNGRIQRKNVVSTEDRAFSHIDYIRRLLPLGNKAEGKDLVLITVPAEDRIALFQDAGDLEGAIKICSDFLTEFPSLESFQSKLSELYLQRTLQILKENESKNIQNKDENCLIEGINHLEKLQKLYPCNLDSYEILGLLYHLRAVNLANNKNLSAGLVEAEKALTVFPTLKQARETKAQIIELIEDLQKQMIAIEAELAKQPGSTLNEEGLRLKEEANRGFEKFETYKKSWEAKELEEKLTIAQGRALWKKIGLPPPVKDWDVQAATLVKPITQLLNNPPQHLEKLPEMWKKIRTEEPNLQDVDDTAICLFVESRILNKEYPGPSQEAEITFPMAVPCFLNISEDQKKQKSVPFDYWFFSNQGIGIKTCTFAAFALLTLSTALTTYDVYNTKIRHDAYEVMVSAAKEDNEEVVLREASKFLSAGLIGGKDERESHVKELKSQGREAPNRRVRDEAFAKINEAVQGNNYISVLLEAEKYLSARPLVVTDNRRERVLDLYSEVFVKWFVGISGNIKDQEQERINQYKRLVGA